MSVGMCICLQNKQQLLDFTTFEKYKNKLMEKLHTLSLFLLEIDNKTSNANGATSKYFSDIYGQYFSNQQHV